MRTERREGGPDERRHPVRVQQVRPGGVLVRGRESGPGLYTVQPTHDGFGRDDNERQPCRVSGDNGKRKGVCFVFGFERIEKAREQIEGIRSSVNGNTAYREDAKRQIVAEAERKVWETVKLEVEAHYDEVERDTRAAVEGAERRLRNAQREARAAVSDSEATRLMLELDNRRRDIIAKAQLAHRPQSLLAELQNITDPADMKAAAQAAPDILAVLEAQEADERILAAVKTMLADFMAKGDEALLSKGEREALAALEKARQEAANAGGGRTGPLRIIDEELQRLQGSAFFNAAG